MAVLVAVAVRSIAGLAPGEYPYTTMFAAVIITAFVAGTGPAVLCATLGGAIAWYYWVPPVDSFGLDRSAALGLVLFVGVSGVIILILDLLDRTSERLAAEQRESDRLIAQQRTMFAELQHRVANNLAFLSGILHLQKKELETDPERAAFLLDETVRRLSLMGQLHRRLHDPAAIDQPVPEYLHGLCSDLLEATGARNIVCMVDADDIRLDLTKLTALSLLLAELMTNSLKHAFGGRDGGTITVDLKRLPKGLVALEVSDDGPGVPADFKAESSVGLGLKIMRGLAAQLGGELTFPAPGGAATRLVFQA